MSDDIVKFLLPDGTEVSNDPRFDLEKELQKQLDNTPYGGDAGIKEHEQKAQTQVERVASMNSGQPGVGENAVPDDVVKDAHGPLGSPAQQVQEEDRKKAEEAGADPKSTSVEDDEPVDSNQAVLEAREAEAKRQEVAAKAAAKLGEDGPGDTEKPYSEWSPAQIKAEVARRNAERGDDDQLVLKGKKKADAVKMLEEDDEAQSPGADDSQGSSLANG